MPAVATCDDFLAIVRNSGIVDSRRLTDFLDQWPAGAQPQDPVELANSMVEAGLLTRFQRDQMLQGRHKGFLIADRYILLEEIGSGGMGAVYLCEHKVMRRRVALKVLPNEFAKDPEYLERFHREARAAAALDHPNIVRAHDADRDGKTHFLVMEYIEGTSLFDLVQKEGPLDYRRAADFMMQAASGLQHAHEAGLVHRDIKPANLLVDRKGTLKILDMGLAVFFQEQESVTKQYDANAVLGTADYLAPEQALNSHNVDIRADIYSLGLTFYFLLTGKNPYAGGTVAQKLLWHQLREVKPVRELRPEVPAGLAAVLTKMIAKDKGDRYQTPRDLAVALVPWVSDDSAAGLAAATATGPASPAPTIADAPDPAGRDTANASAGATKRISPPAGTRVVAGSKAEKTEKTEKPEPTNRSLRTAKTARVAETEPATKSAKAARADDEPKTTAPRSAGSGKTKRAAKTQKPGFWTKGRTAAACIAGTLLLLIVGAYVVATVKTRGYAAVNKDKSTPPTAAETKSGEPPGRITLPSVPPPTPKMVPATTPPATPKTATPAPSATPTPMPTPMPKAKPPETPKTTPAPPPQPTPKPMPTPTPKPVPMPTPATRKPQSLTDYFPKAGETRFYDIATYAGGTKSVIRQKWEYKAGGIIETSTIRAGSVEGASLLQGGAVRWTVPVQRQLRLHYRTADGTLELGQFDRRNGTTLWDPILPLSAAEGDTGKWRLPTGNHKTWTLVKTENVKGKPAITIRDTISTGPDTTLVTVRTFIQGVGEVSRSVTSEKKGDKPTLLGEVKLVDD